MLGNCCASARKEARVISVSDRSLVPTDADWSVGISGTDIEIGLKLFARRLKVNA
jgi:hypothetical protein